MRVFESINIVGGAVGLLTTTCILVIDAKPTFQPQKFVQYHTIPSLQLPNHQQLQYDNDSNSIDIVLDLRGGATRKKKGSSRTASLYSSPGEKKKDSKSITATGKQKVRGSIKDESHKSAMSSTLTKYNSILPLTRIYITMVGIVTLLGLILGEEMSQGLLALDPIRTIYGLELWRPITAACFFGPPSIGWLMNAYYLFEYGSSLERAFGTSQHLLFLFLQIAFLSVCSAFFGQPFFSQSVITSMLHVLSRSMPNQKVKWLIFTVPYWTLPYGLMASDVLQSGNAMAALPHILGILSGHLYYFHKNVWPKIGGEDWLIPPEFVRRRIDEDYRNGGGGESNYKESISHALKARKKGRGKKLGG